MENRVITIARSYGSGGRKMGRLLAKELGYEYYDREILRIASDESGISEELFNQVDERQHLPLFRIAREAYTGEVIPPDSDDFISNENLFRYQARVIHTLAKSQSCVLIGRCADYILKDRKNVLRLYVHAPFEVCVGNVMKVNGVEEPEAARMIRRIDKRRAEYYRHFTGTNWRDAEHYDLSMNTGVLSWEQCVELVQAYLSIRFGKN